MRVTAMNADYGGCGFYRIIMPYEILRRCGHEVNVSNGIRWNSLTMALTPPADVLVVQRPGNLSILQALDVCRHHHVPIVVELDDLLWNIPAWNPAFQLWRTPKAQETTKATNNLLVLRKFIAASDAVTVSTAALATEMKALFPTKPIYVLPNYLPVGDWPAVDHYKRWHDTGTVTVGWGGSATHKSDLMVISGLPAQVAAQHDFMRMHFYGYFQDAHRILAKGLPASRLTVCQWVPVLDVPQEVAKLDVGLAPVDGHRFNLSKSDLKAVEYGACAIPTIATDSETYRSFVRDGENGFLCRTTREWLQALEALVTNHPRRIAMGAQARKDAEARDIEYGIHLWEEALTEIIARKHYTQGDPHGPVATVHR